MNSPSVVQAFTVSKFSWTPGTLRHISSNEVIHRIYHPTRLPRSLYKPLYNSQRLQSVHSLPVFLPRVLIPVFPNSCQPYLATYCQSEFIHPVTLPSGAASRDGAGPCYRSALDARARATVHLSVWISGMKRIFRRFKESEF